jgi:hypothetical protein
MINDISNKVSTQDHSQKSDNKNSSREAPAKSELENRSDLRNNDTVEISGHQSAEKVIEPVSGQDKDVQLQSDVSHQEANADGHLSPNVEKSEKSTNDTNDRAELSDEQRKDVEELQKRDNEVRQHENAHVAAAGAYAQGVSYEYQAGPDGQRYAVGGEVSIDTSPVHDNPDATIAKAQVIRSAANAPVDLSAQDRQVAAATRMEAAARTEKTTESTKDDEVKIIIPGDTDTKSEVNETNDPAKGVPAKEESSLVDALTSAYGTKETEVGKVIRMTA